ncbi:carbohydrate sulfotransferase 10-like isoform X2 [Anneissia japonica]|nr:carbohydrate sulfotransferase 10-like isoform X2 [Anneissia japonica]
MKNCSVEKCTFEEVQRERKLHAWRVCNTTEYRQTNNSYFARHRFDHMYYLNRTGIVFCTVPKAASTTLKKLMLASNALDYNFVSIKNTHDVFDRHVIKLSKLLETEIMNILHNSTKIMIVRHPFTRLLSAFKDKLEPIWAESYFPRSDFILHIQTQLGLEKSGRITFSDFLRYLNLLDNEYHLDAQEHWREIYKICMPCEVKYDVIGKFEHLYDGELESIYRLLNISDVYIQPEHYTGASEKMVIKQYFSTLSKETLKRLYQRYRIDFALFSYRMEAEKSV